MQSILKSLTEFYLDSGVEVFTGAEPRDHLKPAATIITEDLTAPPPTKAAMVREPQSSPEAAQAAAEVAAKANSLGELAQAIKEFDGLSVKMSATQMVFADGHPEARIMVIGEAPGADEDRLGRPFVGKAGQLLDKMFAAIGLSRTAEDPKDGIYISNILNWRPPGNRTPTPQEMEISLPFIERHIQLVRPQIIMLMGATPAKALLSTNEGITRIRGKWQDYQTQTTTLGTLEKPVRSMASFHPAYLLRQPLKKRESWADLLAVKAALQE